MKPKFAPRLDPLERRDAPSAFAVPRAPYGPPPPLTRVFPPDILAHPTPVSRAPDFGHFVPASAIVGRA